jgi:uncharacterized protein (TIGR00645 family)
MTDDQFPVSIPGEFMFERTVVKLLSLSRWLLAPFYFALVVTIAALLVKTAQHLFGLLSHVVAASDATLIVETLKLVDLTLTASLLIIVIFAGYSNFVATIKISDHSGWPAWMSNIDFAGLKLKLLSSMVAISAVQLLTVFMNIADTSDRDLTWYVVIHVVFVVSGLLLALTDRLSGESKHQ